MTENCRVNDCQKRLLVAALEEIAKGQGTFSNDRYEHACNTIADMKHIAKDALASVSSPGESKP